MTGRRRFAAQAIAVGLLTNTILKLGLVLVVGSAGFRRVAGPGLLALGIALAVSVAALA